MVHRSTVDRSPQPAMYLAGAADQRSVALASGPVQAGDGVASVGAGWSGRSVSWLVQLVIGYRGVMAIVLNETPPANSNPAPTTRGFPAQEGSAYALQFGQVYLNASPAEASQRVSDLAAFLPQGGSDLQLGWNGGGSLSLQYEAVAGVGAQDAQHATVTPPSPQPVNSDDATQSVMMRQLPAFFAAYASGDQSTLGRFLAPGTTVTGLGGSVVFGSVTSVTTPAGGDVRHVVATVVWGIPGQSDQAARTGKTAANLEMTYALTIVKQRGTWYVQSTAHRRRLDLHPVGCHGPLLNCTPHPGVGRCRSIR